MEENKAETSGEKIRECRKSTCFKQKSEGKLTGKPGLSRFTRNRAAA